MAFTEMAHAFIAAKYYVHLKEAFGERGDAAFLHATRYYAEQRGRRMAQRAIRDGKPLTYEVYREYGEWVNTPEAIEQGIANRSELISENPDWQVHVHCCPWHYQFAKMGLPEGGLAYCHDLDASIARGFNPEIKYSTSQTLHDHEYCIQTVLDSGLTPGKPVVKNPEGLKSFEFHCAHSYWAYNEVTAAIFGAEGEQINALVLREFALEYGQEMADVIASYRGTNFNIC